MIVERNYEIAKPKLNGPHKYYGRFSCTTDDERENNLLAGYAERMWPKVAGDNIAVSFSAGEQELVFWVNASTKELVKRVIDGEFENLKQGFERKGLEVISA